MRFEMSPIEIKTANKWIIKHDKVCPLVNGNIHAAIGGRITYTFTPTSLGMACGVSCACGESKEVTDVSDW